MDNLSTETPEAQAPDWLTPRDLQTQLRIGEKLAYRLLRGGEIPSVKVGNLYRVRRETLEDLKHRAMSEESAMSA